MATRKSWEDMNKLGRAARARRQTPPPPPPSWDSAEDYPDYRPHPTEDRTAGVDRGLMSDRFYDMLERQGDPSRMLANSRFANQDYNVRAGQGQASTYDAQQRAVGEGELSQNQLDQMLASGSPLMRRAAAQGRATAAGRGLMNSAMAAGMAQGAMIDRAQPFALQDAQAYGRTAAENMAAENLARKTGAELLTRASLENAQMRTQAGIAGMQAGAARDRVGMEIEGRGWDTIRQAMIDIERREDDQAWRTAEAEAGRNWQTGERLGTQDFQASQNELNRIWTSGENAANRTRDWAIAEMQAQMERGATREQAAMQILSSIYSNPKLKADQAKAAAGNAMRIIREEYGEGFGDFAASLPPWERQMMDSSGPPPDDEGNPDYSQPPAQWPGNDPNMDWSTLPPEMQQYLWDNASFTDAQTRPAVDPYATMANFESGQDWLAYWNQQSAAIASTLPPVV